MVSGLGVGNAAEFVASWVVFVLAQVLTATPSCRYVFSPMSAPFTAMPVADLPNVVEFATPAFAPAVIAKRFVKFRVLSGSDSMLRVLTTVPSAELAV